MIRFINPNYHVILIHYPLALLGVGLVIEILGYFWATGSLRPAGRWMVLIGALASAPAATSGIFAKYDIVQQFAGNQSGNWQDVKSAARLSGLQWHFLNLHVLCGSIGAALAVLGAMVWLAISPQWPRPVGAPLLLLFVVAMGLMGVGAYNAGEMVYRTQFATQSQAQSDKLQKDWNAQTNAASPAERWQRRIEYYVDTMQTHLIAAGLVFALAAAGLGLSFQKSSQLRRRPPSSPAPGTAAEEAPPVIAPAGSFWMLTGLAALATAILGWYVFSRDLSSPLWNVKAAFLSQIWQPYRKDPANNARMLAHLCLGSGILVLALLFIPAVRWGGKSRLLIGLLGLIMIAAVACQIYIGVLMMYDTDGGSLLHFNPATADGGTGLVAQN